jgi:hypothetical protein
MPSDILDLIKVWLEHRFYYVSKKGENLYLFDLLLGTVQGLILGPLLYTIFGSLLFDVVPLLSFADDRYDIKSNMNKDILVKDMEKSIAAITKWLNKSS